MALVALARSTQPNFRQLSQTSNKAQLLTIPYSNFCELGRWYLKAPGTPFDECADAPGAHVLPALSVRLGGKAKNLSTSSFVTPVNPPPLKQHREPRARTTSVPILVLPDGRGFFATAGKSGCALFVIQLWEGQILL